MSEKDDGTQTYEELIEEIKQNARNDRKRLEDAIDELCEKGHADVEELASVTDALTKSNAQLVEVAKIAAKRAMETASPDEFDENDREDMFEDIEKPHVDNGRN